MVRKIQTFKALDSIRKDMIKYSFKEQEIDLEDKDFLLITAIDNLTNEIRKAGLPK